MPSKALSFVTSPRPLEAPVRKRRTRSLRSHLLFRASDDRLRAALEGALQDELFDAREGLTAGDAARLSYERARFIVLQLRGLALDLAQDPRALFLLHELLGPVDGTACTILGIHFCLAIGSIVAMGQGKAELEPFLAELRDMRSVGVFLATELGYGNSVMSLETTARYEFERDEFVLNSPSLKSLKFMPNTAFAVPKIAVVLAKLLVEGRDCGVFPFVIRLRDAGGQLLPGINVTALSEKPGYALDNGITAFDDVRVPRSHWLSGPESELDEQGRFRSRIASRRGRFLAAMDRVQTGRVCFTSGTAALLRSATWIATRYAGQRVVGAPNGKEVCVLRYRNVQADLFRALAEAYALTFAVRAMQDTFVERPNDPLTFNFVAVLKATVSERTSELIPKLRERCGAVGMLSANRIIDYWVYTQGIITAEGDNQLMLLKVGRSLLDATDGVDPVDSPPLFDCDEPGCIVKLARYRELRLRRILRQKISFSRSHSRDPLAIWNDHVIGVLDLARAFGVRVIAEKFYAALCGLDTNARRLVLPLFQLWAMHEVMANAAWFLAEDCLSHNLYRSIPEHTDRLLGEIEGCVDELLEGLGVNNETLRAPIADDYIEHYARRTLHAERRRLTHAKAPARAVGGNGPAPDA